MPAALTEKDRLALRETQGRDADAKREALLAGQRKAATAAALARIAMCKERGLPITQSPFRGANLKTLQEAFAACTTDAERAVVFEALYKRKRAGVLAVCYRQSRDDQQAHEAAGDTWLNLWRHITDNSKEITTSLDAFVNTTARHTACDAFRKEQRQTSIRPLADDDDGKKVSRTARGRRTVPFSEIVESRLSAHLDGGGCPEDFDFDPARYVEALHVPADQEDETEQMIRNRLVKAAVAGLGQALREVYEAVYVRGVSVTNYAREAGITEKAAWKRRERLEKELIGRLAVHS